MNFEDLLEKAARREWGVLTSILRDNPNFCEPCNETGETILTEVVHLLPPRSFIEAFVQCGGEINARSVEGYSASLALAESCGGHDVTLVFSSLQDFGADLTAIGYNGWSALHFAVARSCEELVVWLVSNNVCVNKLSGAPDEETPLHVASRNSNEAMVGLLLELGADVHARDSYGMSAIDCAFSLKIRKLLQGFNSS